MKKLLALMLCGVCALSLAACGEQRQSAPMTGVQLANPFVGYDTLDEAAAAAGFGLSAPEQIDGYDAPAVQLMNGEMLQLIFRSGDDRLIIRKTKGSADISGDYAVHAETRTARINGVDVSLRGEAGKVSTAVWCANGFSYALLSDVPLASDVMTDLIAEIA